MNVKFKKEERKLNKHLVLEEIRTKSGVRVETNPS
jgi:hypothetical protein